MVGGVIKYIEFTADVEVDKRGSTVVKQPFYNKF